MQDVHSIHRPRKVLDFIGFEESTVFTNEFKMGMGYQNVTYVFIDWIKYFTLEAVRYSDTGRRRASFLSLFSSTKYRASQKEQAHFLSL